MEKTKIEWATHTFNPWIGCTRVSPGCLNCYAEARDVRFAGGAHWGKGAPRQLTSDANWKLPLKWNREAGVRDAFGLTEHPRVFCASLADWLDKEVDPTWLARLLWLIAKTPNLDWLLLTKRPQNWLDQITVASVASSIPDVWDFVQSWVDGAPPANVWVGTTVEDQTRADERIPHLLLIPARVRFLSCEPLLGPLDISGGLRHPRLNVASTWAEFTWPEWVPSKVREQVQEFWSAFGRGPKSWAGDAFAQGGPAFGEVTTLEKLVSKRETATGRFVHAWNNIGRLVHDDGSVSAVSFHRPPASFALRKAGRGVDWVICGGESGPGARPMHPDWARALRDQCAAARVPFLFKQHGEWVGGQEDDVTRWRFQDGKFIDPHAFPDFSDSDDAKGWDFDFETATVFRKVGKTAAGRLLDGREHTEFPISHRE